MMINVDHFFAVADSSAGPSQALKAGAIGCDDEVELFAGFGTLHDFVRVQKRILLGEFVFVPTGNGFAFVAERESQGELGANAIAVGTDVPDDAYLFAFANF